MATRRPFIDISDFPPTAPPAEPVVTEPPKPTIPPPVDVVRFGMADLQPLGNWLMERLRDAFPHLNERMLFGWLRGVIDSNEYLFVRSPRAVALATVVYRPLSAHPVVEEVFVLAMSEADIPEAAQMYPRFRQWAESIGAGEIVIERLTDVPHEMIRLDRRLLQRQEIFVRLPQQPV